MRPNTPDSCERAEMVTLEAKYSGESRDIAWRSNTVLLCVQLCCFLLYAELWMCVVLVGNVPKRCQVARVTVQALHNHFIFTPWHRNQAFTHLLPKQHISTYCRLNCVPPRLLPCRIFCLPVCFPKICSLRYKEL